MLDFLIDLLRKLRKGKKKKKNGTLKYFRNS